MSTESDKSSLPPTRESLLVSEFRSCDPVGPEGLSGGRAQGVFSDVTGGVPLCSARVVGTIHTDPGGGPGILRSDVVGVNLAG